MTILVVGGNGAATTTVSTVSTVASRDWAHGPMSLPHWVAVNAIQFLCFFIIIMFAAVIQLMMMMMMIWLGLFVNTNSPQPPPLPSSFHFMKKDIRKRGCLIE